MAQALARLWTKFLPEMERRLALLQVALDALADGDLHAEQRQAAHEAAHKLAGTLGTFGLHRGTELARQLEDALEAGSVTASAELLVWTEELRAVIQRRG